MTGWDGDWQGRGLGEEKTGRRDDMQTENWEVYDGERKGLKGQKTGRDDDWKERGPGGVMTCEQRIERGGDRTGRGEDWDGEVCERR